MTIKYGSDLNEQLLLNVIIVIIRIRKKYVLLNSMLLEIVSQTLITPAGLVIQAATK